MSVNEVNKTTGETSLVAGGTLYADAPIGAILAYGGSAAPVGWMICNGAAVSRTTYAALFAAIGTAFGAGDGSTTFNIPDLREATTKGAGETGQTVGNHVKSGGLAVGEFIDDRVQDHEHALYGQDMQITSGSSSRFQLLDNRYSSLTAVKTGDINSSTGRKGVTTEVKAVGVNYIIKAEQVALPADFETEVRKKLDKFYLDTSGLDLDDCTEAGLYEINLLVANIPPGADGGNMIVSHNPSSGAVVQTYFATNTQIASRYKLSGASWTDWLSPFTNRPAVLIAQNVQGTSDASGNIILANSLNNVIVFNVRVRGNYTWTLGYNSEGNIGYYIHLMDYTGEKLGNQTVTYDVIYCSHDWS